MRPFLRVCPIVLALAVSWPRAASSEHEASTDTRAPVAKVHDIAYEKYELDNGLEVILHRDTALPLVAVNIWYHVGPANEPRGRSGFAHLFEHLMFEGSRHVGRRFDTLLESAGATNVNGTTSWDRTNYYETLPRQHLELALWIESDRMGFMLDTLDAARLEVQRGVVKNERRQSYENAPYGPSRLELLDTLFPAGHPYHGAIIGSMVDLDAATMKDVASFYRSYYAPSNATLAVAGDFTVSDAKRWIARYFGTLPRREKPARPKLEARALTGVERAQLSEPVELSKVSMGFIVTPAFSAEEPALELAAAVLAGGKATRLYRALVVEQKLASDVEADLDANQLAGIFTLGAVVASGKSPSALEAAIDAELRRLVAKGPSEQELERARRRLLVELLSSLGRLNGPDGESGRAGLLQRFNHYLGTPSGLSAYVERLLRVRPADVQRVVGSQLDLERRVIVTTLASSPEQRR